MTDPPIAKRPRPTGLRRRRARRLPALVHDLEPDGIEVYPLDGSGRLADPVAPSGRPPEALYGPVSRARASGGMTTPGSDQGERRRPPRKRYARDGVPVVDAWPNQAPATKAPNASPGPSRPSPRPRPRPDPRPDPLPAAESAEPTAACDADLVPQAPTFDRLEWDRQRAEVHALMAAHDAVMADYHRELDVKELRARIDRIRSGHDR